MLQHHGIPTANFIVVGVDEELHFSKIKAAGLSFPVFAKPVAEGSSKGIFGNSRADTYIELEGLVKKLKAQFRAQSILIETFLSGRDITVSILGTGSQSRVIGSLEWARLTNDKKIDRRMNGQSESDFVGLTVRGDHGDKPWIGRIHPLDASDRQLQAAYDVALRTWRVLSCRDAGRVDIRFNTMGETAVPNVLEVCYQVFTSCL